MEPKWLTYAKRLQALAGSGLHYNDIDFDRERYAEVAEIARAMMADLGDGPVEKIPGLFPEFAKGYATPSIDVRGAIVEDGRLLLVREKMDGLWTMPGGFADVGLSAGENVVKEVFEEAGITVEATRLYAVLHKAKRPYPPDVRDFYKFFFLCTREDRTPPVVGSETSDVGFFAPDEIPPLSLTRNNAEDVERAFQVAADPSAPFVFD